MFVRTPNGRLQPLDAEPNRNGNIAVKDGTAYVLNSDLFDAACEVGEVRYTSHFATCTKPENHRRKRGKR
jgi:hypothetical protein